MRPGDRRDRAAHLRDARHSYRRRAFAVLWFGQFSAVAGLTVVVPLLPFYLAGLGVPEQDVAWWTGMSLAAPAITQMIVAPLWGMVADRYGRKAMVVRAHAGLALSVGLMVLADTPSEFLAYRLLQGACGGVVGATATFASSLAPVRRRGRVLGGLAAAISAGSLLGPLLGSLLASGFGYGALFGSVAGLLAVSSLLALVLLREPVARDHRGTACAADATPLRAVVGQLVRTAQSRQLLLAGLAGQAAVYALVVVFAPRVGQITGSIAAATVWVGALQAVTWAATLVGAPWWGYRNERRRPHIGFALAAAGCGLAVALQAVPTAPAALLPLRIVQGFCFATLAATVLQVANQLVSAPGRGTCMGFTQSVLDFGQVVGPMLGVLAAVLLPPPGAFTAIGLLFGLAAALALRSARATRRGASSAAVIERADHDRTAASPLAQKQVT
ncbi:MAG: MFS transporter [Actinomycetota bacterium]|nr:MFS transporter [Actinomycetota bacterium]